MTRFLFTLFLLFSPFTFGQQEEVILPNPSELKSDWWQLLDPTVEQLQRKAPLLESSLRERTASLSEKNRQIAELEIEKITRELQTLIQTLLQPKPLPTPPPPIAESYTIDSLITLQQNMRNSEIALQALEDDRALQQQKFFSAKEKLDKERTAYTGAEIRSEQKFILGLQIIANKVAKTVAEEKVKRLDLTIKARQKENHDLKEELKLALTRIHVDAKELFERERALLTQENIWNEAKSLRLQKETEHASKLPSLTGEELKITNRLFIQELIQADLTETLAYNDYLQAQILYDLALVLHDPSKVNAPTEEQLILQWKKLFILLQKRANEWTEQVQNQVQTTSQILSGKAAGSATLQAILQKTVTLGQENLLQLQQLKNELASSIFLIDQLEPRVIKMLGTGEFWLFQIGHFFYTLFQEAKDIFSTELFTIGDSPVTLMSLTRFFGIILIAILISRLILGAIDRLIKKRRRMQKSLVYKMQRLIHYFILAIGFIVALSAMGFDFSRFILIAGALGVGLGFGLQQIFNNFISGIIMLFETHMKVGDFIEIASGVRGEIREINFRTTIIRTNDGTDVIVPNAEIINNRIVNWTHRDTYRRLHIPFYAPYQTNKEVVIKAVAKAAEKIPTTVIKGNHTPPIVYLINFGKSYMEFELAVWVDGRSARRTRRTTSAYLSAIDDVLNKLKIKTALPQREITIKNLPKDGIAKFK